jgi:hypothetical protein
VSKIGEQIGQAMHNASQVGGPWPPCSVPYGQWPECEHQPMGLHVEEELKKIWHDEADSRAEKEFLKKITP